MSTQALELSVLLSAAQLDAIAERVARILAQGPRTTSAPRFVDAQGLAAALGVSRDYIYSHARELGGVRIGDGSRPRWRFDLDRALDAANGCLGCNDSQERDTPANRRITRCRRTARKGSSARLLPIRGQKEPSDGR